MFKIKTKDNKLISKPIRRFLLISLGLIICLNIPFNLTVAPSRHLKVIDINGKPISGAIVDQTWDQYSLGLGGSQRFLTNSEGAVELPRRGISTTILSLLRGAVHEFQSVGIHASYFSDESISVGVILGVDYYFIFDYEGKWLRSGQVIFDPSKWAKSLKTITPEEASKMKSDTQPFFKRGQ